MNIIYAIAANPTVQVFLEASGGGLNGLWTAFRTNWLSPIFFAAIAVFAIVFIKDRAWTKLVAFIGIAAVVGVLIFNSEDLFGKDKGLSKAAKEGAGQVTSFGAINTADFLGNVR